MHGPTRADLGAATSIATCDECSWHIESTNRERVRQAARQHAALVHRDKRARWAYDQANHRARMTTGGTS